MRLFYNIRALKDTQIRNAGPGYAKLIFLAVKQEAGNVYIEGYRGEYEDSVTDTDDNASASYVPPSKFSTSNMDHGHPHVDSPEVLLLTGGTIYIRFC